MFLIISAVLFTFVWTQTIPTESSCQLSSNDCAVLWSAPLCKGQRTSLPSDQEMNITMQHTASSSLYVKDGCDMTVYNTNPQMDGDSPNTMYLSFQGGYTDFLGKRKSDFKTTYALCSCS